MPEKWGWQFHCDQKMRLERELGEHLARVTFTDAARRKVTRTLREADDSLCPSEAEYLKQTEMDLRSQTGEIMAIIINLHQQKLHHLDLMQLARPDWSDSEEEGPEEAELTQVETQRMIRTPSGCAEVTEMNSAMRLDMMLGMPLVHLYKWFVCHCLGRYFGPQEDDADTVNPLLGVRPPDAIWRSQSCGSV